MLPRAILRQKGFTLIEILISITVLAVLVSLAIPAMSSLMSRNQIKTAANQFQDNLRQVRYESRTRGNTPVILCAIKNSTRDNSLDCDASVGFKYGWLWFSGSELLGKTYIDDNKVTISISTTPTSSNSKFASISFVKGRPTLIDTNSLSISIPYNQTTPPTPLIYPSLTFSDGDAPKSIVIFDETGRTRVEHTQ